MLEKGIHNAIITRVLKPRVPNVWWYKTSGGFGSRVGVADIIGCARGRAFKIEVKRKGEKARAVQELEINRFIKSGGAAAVVTTVDEARAFIDALLEGSGDGEHRD